MRIIYIIGLLFIFKVGYAQENPGLIPLHIISRTILIEFKGSIGTAFILDHNNKQYFITARHLISNIRENDSINIYHHNAWNKFKSILTGHSINADISVFSVPDFYDKSDNLIANSNNIVLSQEIFFLGFPYGLSTTLPNVNSAFPIAFIKKGILSSFLKQGNVKILFLDGMNNPGFSGGPIVYMDFKTNKFNICGIISGYRPEINNIKNNNQEINLQYSINSGIIIGYGIEEVINLIEKNPNGSHL